MINKKIFNIKTLVSFLVSIFILSISCIVIAGPDLEKDIKIDLSTYINNLNNGKISEYYNIYNTRKLTDIEKSLFYDKIKNATNVIESEFETFKKFKLKVKIKKVDILRKVNDNIYLCNLSVDYQIREGIKTTKTIKKSEDYILKILYTGKDGYKILLPFNSMDKDFSSSGLYIYLDELYKDKKAKEVEEKRILEENKKEEEGNQNGTKEEITEIYEDEHGLGSTNNPEDLKTDSEKSESNNNAEHSNSNTNDNNIDTESNKENQPENNQDIKEDNTSDLDNKNNSGNNLTN